MPPLQFKGYSISQRIVRWNMKKDCETQKKKIMGTLDPESKEMPLMLCDIAVPTWAVLNQMTNPEQNLATD